jgi:hypothetical protein
MKVSDEIREWFDISPHCEGTFIDQDDCKELRKLADRIDSEMVEMPKSVDGKIWTGREVCFWTGPADEDWHKFCGLHYSDGRWCVEDKDFERYPAASVWYERPDSLERIADELEEWSEDNRVNGDSEVFYRAADLAERIRKLAKKEDKR